MNYEDCENCYDWDVGMHGIIIKFYFGGNHYDGELQVQWVCG